MEALDRAEASTGLPGITRVLLLLRLLTLSASSTATVIVIALKVLLIRLIDNLNGFRGGRLE